MRTMKPILRGLFVAFAALLTFASPARAAWIEGRTEHFTFYGDMSPDAMRQIAERLERYDAAMRRITGAAETPDVTIYIVPSMADVQNLYGAGGGRVGGFYTASAQGAIAFVPLNDGSMGSQYAVRPMQILFHEYAHHMLLGNVDQYMPGWASEGMAELFMTVSFGRDGSLTFGAPSLNRGFGVMANDRFTLEQLLTSDSRRLRPEEMEQKYSRGWLLVHYLLLSGNRPGQFGKFVELLNRAVPVMDAAREAFGDLGQLNQEFDRYRRSPRFRGFRLTAEQLGATPQVTIRNLRPGEAAIMPLRMRSARGVDSRTAPLLVTPARRVAAQYPNDPFVQRTLAEIEFDANNLAQAEAAADRTLTLEPENLMAMAYKARVLGRRAAASGGNAAAWQEVRTWVRRANRIDPNHALPLVLFYDTYVAAGDRVPEAAMTGLLRSVVLVPRDETLRVRVALDRIRANDLPTARRVLAPLAFSAHGSSENPALTIVTKIDAGESSEAIMTVAREAHFHDINEFVVPRPAEPTRPTGS